MPFQMGKDPPPDGAKPHGWGAKITTVLVGFDNEEKIKAFLAMLTLLISLANVDVLEAECRAGPAFEVEDGFKFQTDDSGDGEEDEGKNGDGHDDKPKKKPPKVDFKKFFN